MNEVEMKKFGSYLKQIRLEKRLSLRQVEKEIGISNSYLYQIERGERNVPKLEILRKMATLYDVSFASLKAAAQLQEPDEDDELYKNNKLIENAFDFVRKDPDYVFGTQLNSNEVSLEVKRFVVEMYQEATGKNLLKKSSPQDAPDSKHELSEKARQALSAELFRFHKYMMDQGHALLSLSSAEEVADCFREFFGIFCPMGTADTRTLLERMEYRNVYLQPGMERRSHNRGFWGLNGTDGNQVLILLDAARPDPSKIKTLLHEIAEMLLAISYDSNPAEVPLDDENRERWANKMAAFVKMPRTLFLNAVERYGIDLELLSDEFAETLAGVSRHLRDLYFTDKPFYFGRVSLEHDPERHCSDLMPSLKKSGGICVYVADAVKSSTIDWRKRSGGALPIYNVGKMRQFRVMNPRLEFYSSSETPSEERPMLISRLRASVGSGGSQLDLFDQDLAVMIFPMGKKRLNGFFIVAVHHKDIHLFDHVRARTHETKADDVDWLFSWEKEEYKRVPDEMEDYSDQEAFELWGDGDPDDPEHIKRQRSRWLVDGAEPEAP